MSLPCGCGLTQISAVDNDFHQTHEIFKVFEGLEVPGLDVAVELEMNGIATNGAATNGAATNGIKTNGIKTNGATPNGHAE